MKNKEYFLQFLKLEDKDMFGEAHSKMTAESIKELDKMQ